MVRSDTRTPPRERRGLGSIRSSALISDVTAPPCRYRTEFAGFQVCSAMERPAIVTATDCSRCPVPGALESAACPLLRASVELVPRIRVEWCCGATDEPVDPDAPSGCLACRMDSGSSGNHREIRPENERHVRRP